MKVCRACAHHTLGNDGVDYCSRTAKVEASVDEVSGRSSQAVMLEPCRVERFGGLLWGAVVYVGWRRWPCGKVGRYWAPAGSSASRV